MKIKFYLLCVGASLLLTSCGGSSTPARMMNTNGMKMDYVATQEMAYDSAVAEMDYGDSDSTSTSTTEQKLIRRVSVDIELVDNSNLELSTQQLQELASSLGGYSSYVQLDNRDMWAGGNLELRVPKDSVDSFLSSVKEMGLKVNSISDSSEDVTLQYTDTKTRLEVQETALKKYKQYLEQAENMEDFLSIERRIDEIVSEIESYTARLQVLDSQIDYTEVRINITCKTSVSRDSFWMRFWDRISDIWYDIGDTFLDGLEWMLNAFVCLIFIIPVGYVVIRVAVFAFKGKKLKVPERFKRKKKEEVVKEED